MNPLDLVFGPAPDLAIPPMVLAALLSAAPGLLSKLFGGKDPQQKLREQMMALIGGQGAATNQLYQQNLASPAFSQGQQQIAAGANTTAGQLGASLGARGIGTSGTGAILSSLIPSIVGSQQAGLRTSAFQSAQSQAQQQLKQQLEALTGTSGPSQTQQLFGGGLAAFGPMLQQWIRSKYPGQQQQQQQYGGGGGFLLGPRQSPPAPQPW